MGIFSRIEAENLEHEILASYAVKSTESRGRQFKEIISPYRTCFQRDRDRIIHSNAFRRLEYKTQVFVNYEGDHYRTRLTHTLEVVQTAIAISRALRLNTDLTEVIGMAHDLGHTPFGHAGEETLNNLMKDFGGFEHNRQSLRVVDLLEEKYQSFPGLNLSWEVREGIIKHTSAYDIPAQDNLNPGKRPLLEGQAVNLADEIAYNCHDLEDGLRSRILDYDDLKSLDLWKKVLERTEKEGKIKSREMLNYQTVRHLKDILLNDAIEYSYSILKQLKIKNVEDVRAYPENIIGFNPVIEEKNREFREFLYNNLYFNYRIVRMADKAAFFIKRLFERYLQRPQILPPKIQERMRRTPAPEYAICDYIAGMTDRYALDEYKKLFDPYEKV